MRFVELALRDSVVRAIWSANIGIWGGKERTFLVAERWSFRAWMTFWIWGRGKDAGLKGMSRNDSGVWRCGRGSGGVSKLGGT